MNGPLPFHGNGIGIRKFYRRLLRKGTHVTYSLPVSTNIERCAVGSEDLSDARGVFAREELLSGITL